MNNRWWVALSAIAQLGCDFCIARGAKVKTPRGEVNVEDVAVGDEVIVVDPETLEQHVGRVTHVRTAKRECGRLDQLRLTSSHPLYDPEKHEWAPAGDWLLGVRNVLQTTEAPTRVERAERFVGVDDVFDLTVDHPLHTFVADGVVVHNKPALQQRCVDDAGVSLEDAAPCACAGLDAGFAQCPLDGAVGQCTCPVPEVFRSEWSFARGEHLDAVSDGAKWQLLRCADGTGLQVVEQPEALTDGNALRVAPGACGQLWRVTTPALLATGQLWVRVGGAVTRPTPVLMADELVLFGLAPDADGGVRFFTGSVDQPLVANESLAVDTWRLLSWTYDVSNEVRVSPRVAHDGGVQLASPDGGFLMSFAPTRLRLGVTDPSEVELHFAGFELRPR